MANANMQRGHINWIEDMSMPQAILDVDTSFLCGRVIARVNDSSTEITTLGINGGASRLTIDSAEDNTGQFYGPLAFEPDETRTAGMQVRFRITDVSVSSVFVGWTDQNSASEVAIEDEDGTLAANANDCCGLLLEGEQDGTWQTVGVQNAGTATQAVSTNIDDLTDSEFTSVRVDLNPADSGTMKAIVDGVELITANTTGTRQSGSNVTTSYLRSSIVFAPTIGADARLAGYNLDVAEFGWWGNVGSTLD